MKSAHVWLMSSMAVSTSLAASASSLDLPAGSTRQSTLRSSRSIVNSSAATVGSFRCISLKTSMPLRPRSAGRNSSSR